MDGLSAAQWRVAPRVDLMDLYGAHERQYVDSMLSIFESVEKGSFPHIALDPPCNEIIITPGSREACLRAAGAVTAAIDDVISEKCANAFCAVRPPGHRASVSGSVSFCVFNNIAVGVSRARRVHQISKVCYHHVH